MASSTQSERRAVNRTWRKKWTKSRTTLRNLQRTTSLWTPPHHPRTSEPTWRHMLDWMIYFKANSELLYPSWDDYCKQLPACYIQWVKQGDIWKKAWSEGTRCDTTTKRVHRYLNFQLIPAVTAWGTDGQRIARIQSHARHSFVETNKQVFYSTC